MTDMEKHLRGAPKVPKCKYCLVTQSHAANGEIEWIICQSCAGRAVKESTKLRTCLEHIREDIGMDRWGTHWEGCERAHWQCRYLKWIEEALA